MLRHAMPLIVYTVLTSYCTALNSTSGLCAINLLRSTFKNIGYGYGNDARIVGNGEVKNVTRKTETETGFDTVYRKTIFL